MKKVYPLSELTGFDPKKLYLLGGGLATFTPDGIEVVYSDSAIHKLADVAHMKRRWSVMEVVECDTAEEVLTHMFEKKNNMMIID